MRNIAFNAASRPTMLASPELMYVLKNVLEKGTPTEQLIVATVIWRLVANCYKAKHAFRCGSVLESLWSLGARLADIDAVVEAGLGDEEREVAQMVDALRLIFEK